MSLTQIVGECLVAANFTKRGCLQINLLENCGFLTAHIQNGNLPLQAAKNVFSSYVQFTLLPNEQQRTMYQTAIIPNNCNPVYNETFSFELIDTDYDKTIVISVWNQVDVDTTTDLLGCLKFSVKALKQKQSICGLFDLLPINDIRILDLTLGDKYFCLSHYEKPLVFEVSLTRGSEQEFGFALHGDSPSCVIGIEDDSPAQVAGIEKGDCLIAVDDACVATYPSSTVARLIRQAGQNLTLLVARYHQQSTSANHKPCIAVSANRKLCASAVNHKSCTARRTRFAKRSTSSCLQRSHSITNNSLVSCQRHIVTHSKQRVDVPVVLSASDSVDNSQPTTESTSCADSLSDGGSLQKLKQRTNAIRHSFANFSRKILRRHKGSRSQHQQQQRTVTAKEFGVDSLTTVEDWKTAVSPRQSNIACADDWNAVAEADHPPEKKLYRTLGQKLAVLKRFKRT